jgi:hypothetical protein
MIRDLPLGDTGAQSVPSRSDASRKFGSDTGLLGAPVDHRSPRMLQNPPRGQLHHPALVPVQDADLTAFGWPFLSGLPPTRSPVTARRRLQGVDKSRRHARRVQAARADRSEAIG